jgi:hypothetical protein
MYWKILGALALVTVAGTQVKAATLDFTEVGQDGLVPQTVISLSNATITSFGDDIYVGSPSFFGASNGLGIICASPAGSGNCEEDMQIDFADDVTNLSFGSFGVSTGDEVDVTAFLDGVALGNVTVTSETLVDFSAFGAIDSLFFADNSTSAGIGWGDFSFDSGPVVTPPIAAVPLPAGLPLLGIALLGLGLRTRRNA